MKAVRLHAIGGTPQVDDIPPPAGSGLVRVVIGAARRTDLVPPEADEVVDLTAGGEMPPATLIVDGLWGEPVERALAAAPVGVRVVQLGQSAGPEATLQSGWVRGRMTEIRGM